MTSGLAFIAESAARAMAPPEALDLVEWSDKYRILQAKEAAEPGRWRTDRTPYLREIMECLSPAHPARSVVLKKGAQVGGTEVGNNWVGYIVHQGLGNLMVVQPTVELAQRWSRQRLTNLLAQEPLDGVVQDARLEPGSANNMLMKTFPGGVLIITGANSGVGLRSMPARFLFMDELSAYPFSVDDEGDPISNARERSSTYRASKEFLCSTPKRQGTCRITAAYELSDQRQYHVPCPHCGGMQVLVDGGLRWPAERHDEAVYVCEHCDEAIGAQHKLWMLREGEWRALYPERPTAGFHLPGLYSPWRTWADIARTKHRASGEGDAGRQSYVNNVEGREWMVEGERVDWRRLYERREDYEVATVPSSDIRFLTAGVDVQKDRLEVEVKGWAQDRQSWSVEYRVLAGDTQGDEVWKELDGLLEQRYPVTDPREREPRSLLISCMAVDSGYATDKVYEFVKRYHPERVIAVKGVPGQDVVLGFPSHLDISGRGKRKRSSSRGKMLVWPVGSDFVKSELHGYLKKPPPTEEELEQGARYPPGYCHYPRYSEQVFQQLCAEQLVEIANKRTGRTDYIWQLMPGRRNEALDTHVYARAAASKKGLDATRVSQAPEAGGSATADSPSPTSRYDVPKESQQQGARTQRGVYGSQVRSRTVGRMKRPW